MKKILAKVLTAAMAMPLLTACGGSGNSFFSDPSTWYSALPVHRMPWTEFMTSGWKRRKRLA